MVFNLLYIRDIFPRTSSRASHLSGDGRNGGENLATYRSERILPDTCQLFRAWRYAGLVPWGTKT